MAALASTTVKDVNVRPELDARSDQGMSAGTMSASGERRVTGVSCGERRRVGVGELAAMVGWFDSSGAVVVGARSGVGERDVVRSRRESVVRLEQAIGRTGSKRRRTIIGFMVRWILTKGRLTAGS